MTVFGWLGRALSGAATRRVNPKVSESAETGGNPPQSAANPPDGNRSVLPHVVIAPPALWRGGVPPEAVALSHAFEGFSATPYLCSGGRWTIGYGSTRDINGQKVTSLTPRVDEQQATTMALRDLTRAADLAARAFPAGLPPRWGAVMVLMANNMGDPPRWGPTLVSLLREGEWRRAAEQMRHYRNDAGGPSTGLRRRRWAEAAYALGMDAREAKGRAWDEIKTPDDWPALP